MVDECSVKRERARLDSAYVLVSDSRAGQPRTSQAVLSLARYSSFLSCHQSHSPCSARRTGQFERALSRVGITRYHSLEQGEPLDMVIR